MYPTGTRKEVLQLFGGRVVRGAETKIGVGEKKERVRTDFEELIEVFMVFHDNETLDTFLRQIQ